MPGDQCPHPHLFSVDGGAAWKCILQDCNICQNISKLDGEILKAHNTLVEAHDTLVELSKQRNALKSQVNYHHKPLINFLPFELLSEIFTYIVEEYSCDSEYWQYRHSTTTPLRLGGVCQMWRDVSLGTPRLWTVARIKVRPCTPPDEVGMMEEWLRRSIPLPLSLVIEFSACSHAHTRRPSSDHKPFDSTLDLLRSQSSRWSRLDIKIPWPLYLHRLFNGLQGSAPVDLESLSIGWCDSSGKFDSEHVLLPRSFIQADSRFGGIAIWNLPCGFERLTRIEMRHVPIDEVLHVIRNAHNLQECKVSLNEDIDPDGDAFPLPNSPIIVQHLTFLETVYSASSEDMFDYLTLPSLRTLNHEYYGISSHDDFEPIIACLERSSPPLEEFKLEMDIYSNDSDGWYELLPSITSLSLNLYEVNESRSSTQCHTTEEFLAALARRSGTLALPKLRNLYLFTRGMSEASWSSLCEIFEDPPEPNPAGTQEYVNDGVQRPIRRDLLKKITIGQGEDWERDFDVERRVCDRFEELKNVGVELKVTFSHRGPKFGEPASCGPFPLV